MIRLPEDAGIILFFTKVKISLPPIQFPVVFEPEEICSGVKRLRLLAEEKFSCNTEDKNISEIFQTRNEAIREKKSGSKTNSSGKNEK